MLGGVHKSAARALWSFDPEIAHGISLLALKAGLGPRARRVPDPVLATSLAGIRLPAPVGLAAGFDKNAQVADAMLAAGFGFVECGTTTPLPQLGNPRPRVFRLAEDRAVINRLGFNNHGVARFAERLRRRGSRGVVGANIGANRDSTDRVADYVLSLQRLWGLCSYFTINISSPNTPGLRDLQQGDALDDLLGSLAEVRTRLSRSGRVPIFLKVAPDLSETQVGQIVAASIRFGLDGLIVANTTLARPAGLRSIYRSEAGGLSGAPLKGPSMALLRLFHDAVAGRIALIGVGGIESGADAYARIRAGADAVQLYSAMVYQGPSLPMRILPDLAQRLRADGFRSVSEAVGAD